MPEYKKVTKEIDIPAGSGIAGCLQAVKSILEKSRVQEVVITPGRVSYSRFARDGEEEDPIRLDLTSLTPYHVIRNTELEEVVCGEDDSALTRLGKLFCAVSMNQLNPIALACSSQFGVTEWLKDQSGLKFSSNEIFGIPVVTDMELPEDALFLCAAYERGVELINTVKVVKISVRT